MSDKYLKYKKKYLELKKIGGQFNIDLLKEENEQTYGPARAASRRAPAPFVASDENIKWSKSDDYYLAFSRHNPGLSDLSSMFYENSNTSFNENGRYRSNALNNHRVLRKNLTIQTTGRDRTLIEKDYLNLVMCFEHLGIWIFRRIPPSN